MSHIMMISNKNFKNMGFSEYMKSLPYPRCKVVEALAENARYLIIPSTDGFKASPSRTLYAEELSLSI